MYKRKKKKQLSEYGDGVYAAEKLLNKRRKHGRIEYLVLWRGWPISAATWEPLGNILDDRLIEEFEKNRCSKKDVPKPLKKQIPLSKQAKPTKSELNEDAKKDETVTKRPTEETSQTETESNAEPSCSTSAIEPERSPGLGADQLTVQVEEMNEEDVFEVVIESEDDEEGGSRPERDAEARSEHLLMPASEIDLPKISKQQPSATITRNPMLFNQLVNKNMASPNQTSLIQRADLMTDLSPLAQERPTQRERSSPSFRSTASQTAAVRSQAPPKSVFICKPQLVKQVNLVHSLQREELAGQQCPANNAGLDREPLFHPNNRQTNSMLSNSLHGNHSQTPFYSSLSHSPSSTYRASPTHQFQQIIKPRQLSSPFRGHQTGHSLVNVVQPIAHEAPNFLVPTQQQSAGIPTQNPGASLARSANDYTMGMQQEAEQRRIKSFQETSNAILNSTRLVRRHVVPPNIFWRQNALVNSIVITDVINADNVEVTIRECKKKEFFSKGKKKKHKLKMMKLL